jgi:hypothetical protein
MRNIVSVAGRMSSYNFGLKMKKRRNSVIDTMVCSMSRLLTYKKIGFAGWQKLGDNLAIDLFCLIGVKNGWPTLHRLRA